MNEVIVVGGGLSGLACAVALADRGLKVTLVEESGQLGGRAASWTDPATGDVVDIGPHVFHSEYRNMLAFLDRLGTRARIRWQEDPILTVASKPSPVRLRHAPLPPPFSLMPSMIGAPGLSLADLLSMSRLSLRVLQFGEEEIDALDRISADQFLRSQGVTERMIDWWWRFAAMVVTNVPLDRCSAASLMRIHCQLSSYRKLHFGFATVGLAELYVPQALQAIESRGGRVLMKTKVACLLGGEGVRLDDGTALRAGHVVCAVPPQALTAILPDRWRNEGPFGPLRHFEPSPYISCYLWFDRKLVLERFVAHLWSPHRLNYDFYDLGQIRAGWRDRPTVVASNIIYSHRAAAMSDGEVVAATVRELGEIVPAALRARVVHTRVHRIPMAIPCPVVGFERLRPQARTLVPGLVLAGDWTSTGLPCSMESAVRSGWDAAEQVLADLGRPGDIAKSPRGYDGIGALVRPLVSTARGVNTGARPGN